MLDIGSTALNILVKLMKNKQKMRFHSLTRSFMHDLLLIMHTGICIHHQIIELNYLCISTGINGEGLDVHLSNGFAIPWGLNLPWNYNNWKMFLSEAYFQQEPQLRNKRKKRKYVH